MGKEYRLRLLGPVQVERAGNPVRGFESHKAIALLGYLALQERALTRPFLANLFWGDKPEARGRGNLSRVIHNLTSLIPDCLIADRDTIQFRCSDAYWLDTRAFEELIARGDAAALTAAVELYRDELMAGIFLDDCPEFETWLVTERERWRQRVSQVLQTLIAYHTQRGECAPSLRLAARWLDLDPWREEAHRQRMYLLALNGQRSDALAQYETCRRVLADELNAEPTQETTTLYVRIREGALAPLPPPAVLPPHNLPAPLTPFVGRADELGKIAERLANPACRLITLVGPGGIGKTRLALRAALDNLGAFPDGAFLVPLASITSPDLIAPAIARALKLSLSRKADPQTLLLDHLRAKALLLVLDNFEQLRDDPTPLIEILQTAPRVKILLTSRERLNWQAEWVLELEGLPYPKDEGGKRKDESGVFSSFIHHPSSFSAVDLFAQSAQRVNADFALDAEWAGVLRICQLTRGVPLALELAAASACNFSSTAIAEQIERNLNFLATTMRDVPERHRSMRAVFDYSWNRLTEEERRVFRRLAVFRGGFDAQAAASVNSGQWIVDSGQWVVNSQTNPIHCPSSTLHCLAALVNKSLLRQDAAGRYEMHELVRQYAEIKLQEAGEQATIALRHLEYFVALAERAAPELQQADQLQWLERLEIEHDNMRAALQRSLELDQNEAGLHLAATLSRFWLMRGYFTEGRRWLETLQSATASAATRADALHGAGMLAHAQGDHESARQFYQQALTLRRELGDRKGMAPLLGNLGTLASTQGDFDQARELEEAGLALKRELGDRQGVAVSLNNLAINLYFRGEYLQARQLQEESLALRREFGDRRKIAAALLNLGGTAYALEDFARAHTLHAEALTLFQEAGDKRGIVSALNNLGVVLAAQGQRDEGTARLEQGLALARELGDKRWTAILLGRLGEIILAKEETARARELFAQSMRLAHECADRTSIVLALDGLAKVSVRQNQVERAARLFGAVDAQRGAMGVVLAPPERVERARYLERVQATTIFATAWAEGKAMSLEQAIQYALEK
jgi:predicted ATPase/DNA-binding SARP family transcriptional activator/Tfp pilus assembly protein PilF